MPYQHLQLESFPGCSSTRLLLPAAICLIELFALSLSAPLNQTLNLNENKVDLGLQNRTLNLISVAQPPPLKNNASDHQTKHKDSDLLRHIPSTALPKEHHAEDLKFISHKPQSPRNAKKGSHSQAPKIIVPLKLDEIQPPEHVDGLRMEQNGHLNHEYKKEIIIGNHEEFERAGSEKKLLSRLKIVFFKADTNHDGLLSHEELKSWIMVKVKEHLMEAVAENVKIFHHLDSNQDDLVSWKEFHFHFLLAKGHPQNDTLKHVEDYETLSIDPEERERLIRYKFRWAEADEAPQDNMLTVEEMKNFRHPEQSSKMIVRMAKDIIENLDGNEDNIITEEEFVALPSHYLDGMAHDRGADDVWQNERRKEFQQVIDINHDGKVDIEELKMYVDPHNENHAHLEADNLIQLADLNSDKKLSIDEVLDNAELFLGSKMVDTGRNFHDEF